MKTLMILILYSSLFSCSNGDSQGLNSLLRRIDSLENHITSLSHERDSLAKIAIRWEYGRDYALYEEDTRGGNSLSWRCARSSDRLKFDESLLSTFDVEMSAEKSYDWRTLDADKLAIDAINYVNTKFEADRYNYYLSVLQVNSVNEAVYSIAYDLAKRDPNWSNLSVGAVASVYAGLIYKQLFNDRESYESNLEYIAKVFKKALIANYSDYHAGIRQ